MIGAAVFLEVISLGILTPLAVTLGAGGVALVAAGVTAGGITAAVWRLSIEKSYMDLLRFLASELTSVPSEKQAKLAESDLLTLERYVIEVRIVYCFIYLFIYFVFAVDSLFAEMVEGNFPL